MAIKDLVRNIGTLAARMLGRPPEVRSEPPNPYRAGAVTRHNKTWQPGHYSGDDAALFDVDLITARVRDLARNDPAILALKRVLTDHVIGTGVTSAAAVMVNDEPEDEFNFEADELFESWCECEADYHGQLGWYDLQRQAFEEMLDNGAAYLVEMYDPDPARTSPLCYALYEAEQLDRTKDQLGGKGTNEIRAGIELDPRGRIAAYWFYDRNPHDTHATSYVSTRVDARRVLALTAPTRPSQHHPVGFFQAITQTARDVDNYLGNELTAATIASLLTVVHKTATPGAGLGLTVAGETTDDNANTMVHLGRGTVSQIGENDSIEIVDPKRPNANARTFIDLMLTLMAMGGGVSRYRLTRDYSGTTYVAGRAAQNDDRTSFRPLQARVARQIVAPARKRWTETAVAVGAITAITSTQFLAQRRRWSRINIQPIAWAPLDPQKSADAAIASIGAGLSTLEDEVPAMGHGRTWRQVIRQLARERRYATDHEVTLNYARPSTPTATEADPEYEAAPTEQPAEEG